MRDRTAVKAVMKISMASDIAERVQRAWGESPFYQSKLKGPAPDRFVFKPEYPFAVDQTLGQLILANSIDLDGGLADYEREFHQTVSRSSKYGEFRKFLHGFVWLSALASVGEKGQVKALSLAKAWFAEHEKWSSESWAPDLTAERLFALCCYSDVVSPSGDITWRSRVLTSMARQTRHLANTCHRIECPENRLNSALSLCLTAICLPGCQEALERGFELLRRELRLQLRIDGGHVSRNPSQQLQIVVRLQMVFVALQATQRQPPGFLTHMLGRARSHLDLFRLGDGRLAVFNGATEDDAKALVSALQRSSGYEEPTGFAKRSGFQRLEAARSVVVVDVGAGNGEADLAQLSDVRYAGTGSFYFSSGKCRIIVNCGPGEALPGDWERLLRLPDAHTTLSFLNDQKDARPVDVVFGSAAHRRAENDGGQLLEISRAITNNGLPLNGTGRKRSRQVTNDWNKTSSVDLNGLDRGPNNDITFARHLRHFYLDASGSDLRGQDELVGVCGPIGAYWRLRFHLHPSVKASLARDGRSVLLALPNREGWRFRSNCKKISIEKSVYTGAGEGPIPSEQIVLSGSGLENSFPGDILVKWGFQRIDDG
ncbi:MAG: heparinase II/III family protein [Pseudomonadota bacterium]